MEVNRPRSQADRSAATRTALIGAARPLFAQEGFAAVGTETIVRAAGVTRGALYHQFADKTELFAAVVEAVEQDVMRRIVEQLGSDGPADPLDELAAGASAWLDACSEPEVQRIVLIDAPAVLGWARWREIGERYSIGVVAAVLTEAIRVQRVPEQPVLPLAHIIVGALDEAALFVARAADQDEARAHMQVVLRRLIDGFAA